MTDTTIDLTPASSHSLFQPWTSVANILIDYVLNEL
jgi:hypothetical protein